MRIRAIWSQHFLSVARIIGYNRMYPWRAKARMRHWECAGWFDSAHFAQARRYFFVSRDPCLWFPKTFLCRKKKYLLSTFNIFISLNYNLIHHNMDRIGKETLFEMQAPKPKISICIRLIKTAWASTYIVGPQWLEHLFDHGNSFETWVVRATDG